LRQEELQQLVPLAHLLPQPPQLLLSLVKLVLVQTGQVLHAVQVLQALQVLQV
jgi:hypothetical protein